MASPARTGHSSSTAQTRQTRRARFIFLDPAAVWLTTPTTGPPILPPGRATVGNHGNASYEAWINILQREAPQNSLPALVLSAANDLGPRDTDILRDRRTPPPRTGHLATDAALLAAWLQGSNGKSLAHKSSTSIAKRRQIFQPIQEYVASVPKNHPSYIALRMWSQHLARHINVEQPETDDIKLILSIWDQWRESRTCSLPHSTRLRDVESITRCGGPWTTTRDSRY